jgi:hypothetical protein
MLFVYFILFILHDFNNFRTYGLEPVYRPIMLRPSNLKWKFVRYDDSRQKLILSNLDRLQQIELPLVGMSSIFHQLKIFMVFSFVIIYNTLVFHLKDV